MKNNHRYIGLKVQKLNRQQETKIKEVYYDE